MDSRSLYGPRTCSRQTQQGLATIENGKAGTREAIYTIMYRETQRPGDALNGLKALQIFLVLLDGLLNGNFHGVRDFWIIVLTRAISLEKREYR